MSMITGSVEHLGAAVDVLVGVSRLREEKLRKVGHPVPSPVAMRLVIDTGSYATGLSSALFAQLGIGPVFQTYVHTTLSAQEAPHLADVFDVSVTLISSTDSLVLSSVLVLSSPSSTLESPTHGILGRDILNRCVFTYNGPLQTFQLTFDV